MPLKASVNPLREVCPMPGFHPFNAMTGAVTIALAITTSTTEAQNLTLTLTVRNDARVEDAVLAKAQATVAKIYSQAGVDVVWLLSGAQLTIILLKRESARARERDGGEDASDSQCNGLRSGNRNGSRTPGLHTEPPNR
jgi:hypothetical protein